MSPALYFLYYIAQIATAHFISPEEVFKYITFLWNLQIVLATEQ